MQRTRTRFLILASALMINGTLRAGDPPAQPVPLPTVDWTQTMPGGEPHADSWCAAEQRGLFESDLAFPGFIGPISNPILSKDPRSLTEARLLFINNQIDPRSALGSGDFQAYAMQVRVALTDRLTFIADKDGYAAVHPAGGPSTNGWLNINAGLKYTLIRDVEDQFLVSAGLTFEPQTGEKAAFQDQGTGVFSVFATAGKELASYYHVLATAGYQFPVDQSQNSTFFYTSVHLDRQLMGWLYPLVEFNWFHYTQGGDRGIPSVVGDGDGLINVGTSGVAGQDFATAAVGLKAKLGEHLEAGTAWEVPISAHHELMNNRLLVELILRY